jgi:hypothetical protein
MPAPSATVCRSSRSGDLSAATSRESPIGTAPAARIGLGSPSSSDDVHASPFGEVGLRGGDVRPERRHQVCRVLQRVEDQQDARREEDGTLGLPVEGTLCERRVDLLRQPFELVVRQQPLEVGERLLELVPVHL